LGSMTDSAGDDVGFVAFTTVGKVGAAAAFFGSMMESACDDVGFVAFTAVGKICAAASFLGSLFGSGVGEVLGRPMGFSAGDKSLMRLQV